MMFLGDRFDLLGDNILCDLYAAWRRTPRNLPILWSLIPQVFDSTGNYFHLLIQNSRAIRAWDERSRLFGFRMDLETENRIASILLREAAELRRQAEKEGVRAYLEKPNIRHRPNSRFLTATVLGVQQSNKAVETNEMWRARKKEIELEGERLKRKSREESNSGQMKQNWSFAKRSLDKRCSSSDEKNVTRISSKKRWYSEDDEGLGDDEIDTFLQSRIKRGRGSIGPRMDETGPYLPTEKGPLQSSDTGEMKVVLGPERPPTLRQDSSNECGQRIRKEYMKKRSDKEKKKEKKRKRNKD